MGAEETASIERLTELVQSLSGDEKSEALCELGNLHEAGGDLKAAARAYSEAFICSPRSRQALANARRVLIALEQWPQALRVMEAEANLEADPRAKADAFDECAKFAGNVVNDPVAVERITAKAAAARAEIVEAPPDTPGAFPADSSPVMSPGSGSELELAPAPVPAPEAPYVNDVEVMLPDGVESRYANLNPSGIEPPVFASPGSEGPGGTGGASPTLAERLKVPATRQKALRIGAAVGAVLALALVVKVGLFVRVVSKCGFGRDLVVEVIAPANGLKGGEAERCLANGVDEGPRITRDEQGKVVGEEQWLKGIRVGPANYTREDTTLEKGDYLNGRRQGVWRNIDAAGQLIREVPYVADVIEGTVVEYGPDGKKVREAEWSKNKPEGLTREFDAEGKVRAERLFVDGKEQEKSAPRGGMEQFAAGSGSQWVVTKASGDPQLYGGRALAWWNDRVHFLKNRRGEDAKQAVNVMVRRARLNGLGWNEAQVQFEEAKP